MANNNTGNVQSLERSLTIIDILSAHPEGLSIKDLSEKTELHKSTVHRLLQTLRTRNYVYQDRRTERYHLGAKILEIAASMMESYDIRSVARPVLEDLCDGIQETVHLSILDGTDAVYIDKLENQSRVLRMYSQVGKRIPVFCSAIGKAMVAWLDDTALQKIVDNIRFEKKTPYTLADKGTFLDNLKQIRTCGYAVDWLEHEESILCVASPIFDQEKHVVAAISISTVVWGLTADLFCKMREQVYQAAKRISMYLGCGSYPAAFVPSEEEVLRICQLRH